MESYENVKEFLEESSEDIPLDDLKLRRSSSEEWFSETLTWLLSPKEDHPFGVEFLNEFTRRIGEERTEKDKYERRETHLKYGKGGKGEGVTAFNFGNATALREYYLASDVGQGRLKGPRFCDIAVLDLDTDDSFVMLVGNKLFTTNHPGQLADYLYALKNRYHRANVREYVFLTLHGRAPTRYNEQDESVYPRWVQMSWVDDILDILEDLNYRTYDRLRPFGDMLHWIDTLINPEREIKGNTSDFQDLIVRAAAECLREELQRLGEGQTGHWEELEENKHSIQLTHSSVPTKTLYIEMLPNYSITVQTRQHTDPQYEKIFVPFGATADQVFNLIDVTAREIYHKHFDTTDRYLGNKRRLRATRTEKKQKYAELFAFLSEYQFQLQVLFTTLDEIWEAIEEHNEEVSHQSDQSEGVD